MDRVTLDTLLLDREQINKVREWLLNGTGILVLTQDQTGSGVSTMISLLLEQLSDRVHAIDVIDAGSSRMSVLGQKKVIILDPFESVLTDQSLCKKLPDLLANPRLPVLVAGFKRRVAISKLDDMLRKCKTAPIERLCMRAISDEAATAYLASIGCDDPGGVWTGSGRDLRHATVSLRTRCLKEHLPDGIDGLRAVLEDGGGRSYADMIRVVENDPTIMLDGLFENYINATSDIHVAADAIDTIGTAEIFAARRYASTCDDMQPEVYGTLAGLGFMGLKLKKPIDTFGTFWARENHRHSKKTVAKRVGLSGAHVEDLPFIREMLYADPVQQAPRLAGIYGDKALWDITRMFPQRARVEKYTSARHASLLQPVHPQKRQKKS